MPVNACRHGVFVFWVFFLGNYLSLPLIIVNSLIRLVLQGNLKACFSQFCEENHRAQKYLLGGLELLMGKEYAATLMPRVPHILKIFYDLDILDEEVILEWAKKVSCFSYCLFCC